MLQCEALRKQKQDGCGLLVALQQSVVICAVWHTRLLLDRALAKERASQSYNLDVWCIAIVLSILWPGQGEGLQCRQLVGHQ